MKKWMVYVLMAVFAAGFAVAQDQAPGRRHRSNDWHNQRTSNEQRVAMREQYEAINTLGVAARTETDPDLKEELIAQLRGKLTEAAEKKQAEFRKRLEKAEDEVLKMRERLEDGEAKMSQRVEEHVQRILSGQPPNHGGPSVGQRQR